MRVSTGEQNLDLQRDDLEKAGCEKIYDDVCSGRATDRPGLAKALEIARTGDALVVWKLDHIGRSLPHVVGLMNDLQQRGGGLKVLTGDMVRPRRPAALSSASSRRWPNSSEISFTSVPWQVSRLRAPVAGPAAGHV